MRVGQLLGASFAVSAALVVVGCAGSASPPQEITGQSTTPSETLFAAEDGQLTVGMTLDEVEQSWGDTDCIFEVSVDGRSFDAWGYAHARDTGEVVGTQDCRSATVALYFEDSRLHSWAQYQ